MVEKVQSIPPAVAGFSLSMLSMGYITLFLIGAVAGGVAWFYKLTHSDPKWSRGEAISEALKQLGFSGLAMPVAVHVATPILHRHNWDDVSVQMLVGFTASFLAVELLGFAFDLFKRRAGGAK